MPRDYVNRESTGAEFPPIPLLPLTNLGKKESGTHVPTAPGSTNDKLFSKVSGIAGWENLVTNKVDDLKVLFLCGITAMFERILSESGLKIGPDSCSVKGLSKCWLWTLILKLV